MKRPNPIHVEITRVKNGYFMRVPHTCEQACKEAICDGKETIIFQSMEMIVAYLKECGWTA